MEFYRLLDYTDAVDLKAKLADGSHSTITLYNHEWETPYERLKEKLC
ncbi:hypothetical protein [Acinetobacter ursingii]